MAKLLPKLRCRPCGFVWAYTGTATTTKCPLCGAPKDCRDRKAESREYAKAHPERGGFLKEWLSNNRHRHSRETGERLKKTVFALVGRSVSPHCANCGCDDVRLLEINHKNGGGGREFAAAKHAQAIYRDIAMLRRDVDDLELLCRVCNAKHYLEMKFGTLPMRVIWNGSSAPVL